MPGSPTDALTWLDVLGKLSPFGLLSLFLIGLVAGWWILRRHHADVVGQLELRVAASEMLRKEHEKDTETLLTVSQHQQESLAVLAALLKERPCLLETEQPRRRR